MKAKSKLKDGVIEYGKVEMTPEELEEAQNVKIRTTMFLEEDLIRAYKREAAKRGLKYQQLGEKNCVQDWAKLKQSRIAFAV